MGCTCSPCFESAEPQQHTTSTTNGIKCPYIQRYKISRSTVLGNAFFPVISAQHRRLWRTLLGCFGNRGDLLKSLSLLYPVLQAATQTAQSWAQLRDTRRLESVRLEASSCAAIISTLICRISTYGLLTVRVQPQTVHAHKSLSAKE